MRKERGQGRGGGQSESKITAATWRDFFLPPPVSPPTPPLKYAHPPARPHARTRTRTCTRTHTHSLTHNTTQQNTSPTSQAPPQASLAPGTHSDNTDVAQGPSLDNLLFHHPDQNPYTTSTLDFGATSPPNTPQTNLLPLPCPLPSTPPSLATGVPPTRRRQPRRVEKFKHALPAQQQRQPPRHRPLGWGGSRSVTGRRRRRRGGGY